MDWLDRSNLGPARQLILPRSNIFARASLETWNRNFSGVVVLATDAPDRLPEAVARIRSDGTLEIDGSVARAQTLVANIAGTAIDLEGKVRHSWEMPYPPGSPKTRGFLKKTVLTFSWSFSRAARRRSWR